MGDSIVFLAVISSFRARPTPRGTSKAADPEARQAMAQARKSARRTARATRRDGLVPRDLGRLPMFTVKTLLGFR